MSEEIQKIITLMEDSMSKSIAHLDIELGKVRAGRANPQMLDNVFVDYYGARTQLSQAAGITTPDPRTIVIQPWEKSLLTPIEKAIQAANLGLNPQNDGVIIRIMVPPLTEERRKDLVKRARAEAENAKVSIRSARKDANEAIKKSIKKSITEDEAKVGEEKIQKLTDSYIVKTDKCVEQKEKEIMTV